jgi:Tfp pilus assembly protein PilX
MRSAKKGAALVISMLFLVLFASLALSLSQVASVNLGIAGNQHQANKALLNAQSGLEIIRFWVNNIAVPGSVNPANRLQYVTASLNQKLASAGVSYIKPAYDGSSKTAFAPVLIDSSGNKFAALMTQVGADLVTLNVTGSSGNVSRTIQVSYLFKTSGHSAFDFGIATKGPLSICGNVDITGANVAVEASVYIESKNQNLALDLIGNSSIAGDVSIVNKTGYAHLQGSSSIGGASGSAAQNHVHIGVPETDFPEPSTSGFASYATTTIDRYSNTSNTTYTNARIVANTNPSFSGNCTFNGILYIETPNIVNFTGNVVIKGMVVASGDKNNASSQNQVNFQGNVDSYSVSSLPDTTEFTDLRQETGTFLLAPGFSTSFGGNFKSINGVIAASGINFYGNAGGQIKGSIINYSDNVMSMTGNSDLEFNRSGTTQNPAGFIPEMLLSYQNSSYTEIVQ